MLLPFDSDQPTYGYQFAAQAVPPAVSVITPYYNTGPIFLETVQSLLRQSLQNWEWIIVNDGSNDVAARRVLLPLRNATSRVRVVDQPNAGLPAARNTGAKLARAPLLFFLDSDDLLMPTALEKLAWSLVARPASAFATAWNVTFGAQQFLWPRGFASRHAFLFENMATSLAMVRRDVFEQVGGFDQVLQTGGEDYEFWLRCAAHGFWGHDLREYLLAVRRKPATDYRDYQWAARDDQASKAAFHAALRQRFPQLYRQGLPMLQQPGGLLDTYAPVVADLPFENPLVRPAGQRRILILAPWLQIGGADRFLLDLAAGLVAGGDRVSVALLRDEQQTLLSELLKATPDVFNLAAFLAPAEYPRFLRSLVASRGVTTIMVANSLLAYQLLPFLRAHCPGVAVVDFQHMEEEWRAGGLPRAGVDHDALIDMHITSSQHLADWMVARGADATRTRVCTTNIDPQRWQPDSARGAAIRAELGIAPDVTIVLFVGRLVAQKRPRLVVEIMRRLRESGTPFVGLMVGDGPERGWIKRAIRQHGLAAHLRMLGAQPSAQVRELLCAADVLLLPSANEGVALALYEALTMGVVPVAADVGGQRELVTPEVGVLVAPGEGETTQYVAALQRLLTDQAQRAQMAAAGRERIVAHFTQAAMIKQMQALFDEASQLAADSPRPPVSVGQGHAAATLAIEHYQLETRLRRFAPVRLALRLRQSPLRHSLAPLAHLRKPSERFDRSVYAARRTVMRWVRGEKVTR